jgi:hypothetical protein
MYALLIVPPPADLARAAEALASTLGGTVYDHRQTLLRGLPWLASWDPDLQQIRHRAAALQAAGLPTWPTSAAALALSPEVIDVRGFERLPDGLACRDRQRVWRLAWPDIAMVMPCRSDAGREVTETTTTRKVGLAQLAMGVPIARKHTETEQKRELDQAFFCLVWAQVHGPDGPVDKLLRFDAEGLDFTGLGPAMTASSTRNYQTLLGLLQSAAPAAWEPRLERAGGRITAVLVPEGTSTDKRNRNTTVTTQSAAWNNDDGVVQAAKLLVLARRLARIPTG